LQLFFFVSSVCVFQYRKFSLRVGILANPNFRTLHETPVPNGGGIVFLLVFITCIFILWWLERLSEDLFKVFFLGATVASLFGFSDDLVNIKASRKLIVQILLSCWVILCFDGSLLFDFEQIPDIVSLVLSILFLVWVINAINFMDGIECGI